MTERSKATDPPLCKTCGRRHWGTCADPDARGALYRPNDVKPKGARLKLAKKAVAAAVERTSKPKAKKARKKKGRTGFSPAA